MEIKFGEYRAVLRSRQLHGPSGLIDISARAFDILLELLKNPGEVVRKGALLDAVWPNLAVEENALHVHVSGLRKALGSSLIVTVHGRGYKYAGPNPQTIEPPFVDAQYGESSQHLAQRAGAVEGQATKVAPNKELTSIAVLPFKNLTGDVENHILAEGLAEDIITELARYRHLLVTGHRISSQFNEKSYDLAAISKELGVDFILDGSVRLAGNAIRVVVELIDAETGSHAWGDRFYCEMTDIFMVQDEIVGAVIGRLAFNLTEAAGRKRERDPTCSSSAYTHFLQARVAWRAGDGLQALAWAQKAVEIDPDYGRAHAYIGFFHAFGNFGQWTDMGVTEIDRMALASIERALAIDPGDPFILQRASMTYFLLGEPLKALRYAETAASVSAHDSEMLAIRGMVLVYCGDRAKGCAMLERAVTLESRLSPSLYVSLMEARHMIGDYAGSLAVMEMIPNPPYYMKLYEAASLARLGRTDEARHILDQAPIGFDLFRFVHLHVRSCALTSDASHWLDSFRLAGIDL